MYIRVGCKFSYESTWPTPMVILVQPHSKGPHTITREDWTLSPWLPRHSYQDIYGNVCQRVVLPIGDPVVSYDAVVEVSGLADEVAPETPQLPVQDLPDNVLLYTLPSRLCQSDVLSDTAWRLFGASKPGWERVQAICDWVNASVRFEYGTSTAQTGAVEIYQQRVGVCRDITHLAVSFCRALNLPTRYVFGYIPDVGVPPSSAPMDFAAWMEVYLGDRWWTFDPRNNEPRIGRVLIGRGRDALDVAMVTCYGSPVLKEMIVWADEVSIDAGSTSNVIGSKPWPGGNPAAS